MSQPNATLAPSEMICPSPHGSAILSVVVQGPMQGLQEEAGCMHSGLLQRLITPGQGLPDPAAPLKSITLFSPVPLMHRQGWSAPVHTALLMYLSLCRGPCRACRKKQTACIAAS